MGWETFLGGCGAIGFGGFLVWASGRVTGALRLILLLIGIVLVGVGLFLVVGSLIAGVNVLLQWAGIR